MDTSYVHLCGVFTIMDKVFSLYMRSIKKPVLLYVHISRDMNVDA